MSRIRAKYSIGQLIKGQVTSINKTLLYFEVENSYRIYSDLTNEFPILPGLNSEVSVTNPKLFDSSTFTAVMGRETTSIFPEYTTIEKSEFRRFLLENEIIDNASEVIMMDKVIVRRIESFINENAIVECLERIYQYVISYAMLNIKQVDLVTVKDLIYANPNSTQYPFLSYHAMCSFNVYPNRLVENGKSTKSQYLFGALSVSDKHGCVILEDGDLHILVKFTIPTEDLYKYNNCLVLITKYTVVAEIFEDSRQETLQYVLVDISDVIKIKTSFKRNESKRFYGRDDFYEGEYDHSFFLETKKISEVIYGYRNGPECWVEALISADENFSEIEFVFGVIPEELLNIVPFLEEECIYKVFTKNKLKYGNITAYRELFGMRTCKRVVLLDPDSIFKLIDCTSREQSGIVLDDFESVKTYINNSFGYDTCSLILKINRKEIQNATFSSWFPKRHKNVPLFGQVDNRQQRIVFYDEEIKSYIDLYLSNRDNHIIPLGLITDMKIKVKHVQVNKRKYLRTTVFSRFEIVEYCPKAEFSCATLRFDSMHLWDWRTQTDPVLLGKLSIIPANCVVHGTILFRAILDLRISVICLKCQRTVDGYMCSRCSGIEKDVDIFIVMNVQDSINPTFNMEVQNKYFLMDILGLSDRRRPINQTFAKYVRPFSIDFLKIPEDYRIHDADAFPVMQRMIEMIRCQINFKYYTLMNVVCVRQIAERRKPMRMIDYEIITNRNLLMRLESEIEKSSSQE